MAYSPATRPDPFEPRQTDANPDYNRPASEEAPRRSLAQYLNFLSDSGVGSLSAEVALDLVLNDIVERTRLATDASAAAIALARNDEMVCRATTGENAPDLGSRLSMSHGLSGTCVRTGEWQRCDDAENDPRVDAAICRRLGVRAILVVPVKGAKGPIGVIEVFSVRSNAFADREVKSLQEFAHEINENVQRAAEIQAPKAAPVPDSPMTQSSEPILSAADNSAAAEPGPRVRDSLTTALLVCVILLALTLGWVAGRPHWGHTTIKSAAQPHQATPAAPESTNSYPIASTAQAGPASPPAARSPSTQVEEIPAEDEGLIITRDGKVVFRSSTPRGAETATGTPPAAAEKAPVRIPPEIAHEYLATRVEPEYPEEARKRHIQGSVALDALVGKDGAVRKVTVVSGNPQLVRAASQAVQQWRFQPFYYGNQPQEFTTRVTLVFRLP